MWKWLLWILLTVVPLQAYDFKVTIRWDEMAMMGEAEGVLQYYHDGKVEAIRGNLKETSSDGNIESSTTFDGGTQEFIIIDAGDRLVNIWVVNNLMDESFATEDDFMMLSNAKVEIWVEDNVNQQTYQLTVPQNTPGLVFRGGAIIDNQFFEFTEMYQHQRIYKVSMVNAATGEPLAGVNVMVKNRQTGETVGKGKTDEEGLFQQKFPYGKYDVLFSKDGFLASKHEFEMDLTELPVQMNFALTPKVDQFRIVLTWGPFPRDLDAHLAGPEPGGNHFHIWWRNRTTIGGKDFLDIDDQNSYGPETITIYRPARGKYTYAVHNYSGRNRDNSIDLSMSQAHVDVYADGKLKASFDIPRHQRGTAWKVFRINEHNQIITLNELFNESSSSGVIR
ncbi:MAG: hypothetical protein GF313_04785 [Caldithrix sp.]|nr:hypothetical protein [Caldithrix sp.]